jgi:glutathione peroxidase
MWTSRERERQVEWAASAVVGALLVVVAGASAAEGRLSEEPVKSPGSTAARDERSATPSTTPATSTQPAKIFDITANRIDGRAEKLDVYSGKVVVIVNVASKCGFTRQYAGLGALYEKRKDAGLVVLGFPSNDFGGQEPGSASEIQEFCTSKFGVTFPMFDKVKVKGDDAHPLYKFLADRPAPVGGAPKWNFTKFVVDRRGEVVARFDSRTGPEDAAFVKLIDDLLAAKSPPGPAASKPAGSDTPAQASPPADPATTPAPGSAVPGKPGR